VPICVVSSVTGITIAGAYPTDQFPWFKVTGQDVNIFTQIGFVVLIGLACKNAILIVEFAKYKREAGMSRRDAILEACTLRFRPILMTSMAFILGVSPLLFAHGAGAEMRQALGLAVFSGMIGVTVFGIFLTPVFFVVIDWATRSRWLRSGRVQRVSNAVMFALRLEFIPPAARWLAMHARNGVRTMVTKVGARK
jgi:multidrug efflux pump